MSRTTVLNVTEQRIQVSEDGQTLGSRSSIEMDTDDEVLTSALLRGEVVLLSKEQDTQRQAKPASEEDAKEPTEAQTESPVSTTGNDEAEDGEEADQAEKSTSQVEETEASEEEITNKKSTRTKVAKEN